jgi:hypothetical protein
MNEEICITITPRAQAAIDELKALISAKYPEASFTVNTGHDPAGIYLKATVDIDDTDDVVELYIDRLVDIQVNEGIPVYVVPLQPIERVIAEMNRQKAEANARFRPTG